MSMYNLIIDRVLSDENVFLAVYWANSYIQEVDLLNSEDRIRLEKLKDIFNETEITPIVKEVKDRICNILTNENDYFNITVFFKPKKRDENTNIFRPIHTASLVDQIAMIALAQILIFDCTSKDEPDSVGLIPSEISRLIPSNFYGNRVSYDTSSLFKPWQEQYHEYTQNANDYLYQYAQSREYQYEVDLDLQNFFPSIDPQVMFGLIRSILPLNLSPANLATIETILKKLLFFKLSDTVGNVSNVLNDKEWCWYLKEKQLPNTIEQKVKQYKVIYAKGLPQGLPHTYYLANLMMLSIQNVYQRILPGKMLFYVDDSVIFTNALSGTNEDFDVKIQKINSSILEEEKKYRNMYKQVYPDDYTFSSDSFGITVHDSNGKSQFSPIKEANINSGEVYLSGLCRETSTLGADLYFASTDEDTDALLSRTEAILDNIKREIERVVSDDIYKDKLIRYKKFFKYRHTVLQYQNTGDLKSLNEKLLSGITHRATDSSDLLSNFFDKYTDDILSSLISFVLRKNQEENAFDNIEIQQALTNLNKQLYGDDVRYSYLIRTCECYYMPRIDKRNPYGTLLHLLNRKYEALTKQNFSIQEKELLRISISEYQLHPDNLFNLLNLNWLYRYSKIIRGNSEVIQRKILNAIYSYILGYEINDTFIFSKRNLKTIQYSDIRILAALRNNRYSLKDFSQFYLECTKDEYCVTADYSLLQVMSIFQSCVILPDRIDQLIRIHKYCCDTWKNGSKYLYFYTLHNQEHAVTLIQNVRKLLNVMTCLDIKRIDYFVIFAACYLHDISMVSFPDYSLFYTNDSEPSNKILSDFISQYEKGPNDPANCKKALNDAYLSIDSYFESKVRGNHAFDSANEIRRFAELDFIEPSMRELIARVAAGHGQNWQEVYYKKSEGRSALVSEKYDSILLRLSDLLDISRYRISKVILNHNLHNINSVSRFHWISHLLTDGYSLKVNYSTQTSKDSQCYIARKQITETIQLTIDVLLSQTTIIQNQNRCENICLSEFKSHDPSHTKILLKCKQGEKCSNTQCNFLCKWFTKKNEYLIDEVAALQAYLNSLDSNFYQTEIEIYINVLRNDNIPNEIFDYLREYVEQ